MSLRVSARARIRVIKITNGRQAGQGTYGNFHVIVRLNTRAEGKKLDPSVRASAKYDHEDGDAFTSRFPVMSSNDPALSLNLACKSRCLRATFISRARARTPPLPPPPSWNITRR